jgi:hypothetical protein
MNAELPVNVRRSWDLARKLRAPWEARWQRLADLAMPYRTGFYTTTASGNGGMSADGTTNKSSIYDETGMTGVDEMSNRLQSGIVPDGVNWARFEGPADADDEYKAGLAKVQAYFFLLLSRSNFAPEANDCFRDLSGPGNTCLRVMNGDWQSPLRFQAVPLSDVWLTMGPNGGIADRHVRFRLPAYAVAAQWPDATLPPGMAEKDDLLDVIESWLLDLSEPTEHWQSCVHWNGKVLFQDSAKGAGSCPFVIGRWNKGAGELYGTGQGMLALPAIEVANEAVRLIMAHAEMALAGMWQAEDDGVLNPWTVQLVPGAIIPKAPGSQGLTPLLLPSTKLDISQLVLEDQRHAIRKALYNETLGKREGTPVSALEVQERMAELARQIGPAFARVWHEFVVPLIVRCRYVLDAAGLITMPLIDGRTVKVASASALVRAAAAGDMRRIDAWLGGIAAHYGPAAVQTMVPAERYMRIAAQHMDIPPDLPFTDAEIKRNAQRLGTMAGQAEAQQPGGAQQMLAPMLAAMGGGRK